ncbi:hypothetical protein [Desulfobacca acetoxidans]|uniref:Uncharacterized protein n=1 Tax=Desulfobacca acetoxidans (strain ATCC 700848 / DSM 11109 / ASRB2) TaxID=880072 RepID=F2NI25_DESAR|nr:hypothetical protein [Desulfobacca acetoxidans]AEB09651.1 hypothetical protein Desac_1811 [Desulfobacca acetoxidans DSM 11109]
MNFDVKSRYAKASTITVTDGRGRTVTAVVPPEAPRQIFLGYHVRRQGEGLDHLAARYLNDPHGYWRLALMNDAMFAEQISELIEIAIPAKGS